MSTPKTAEQIRREKSFDLEMEYREVEERQAGINRDTMKRNIALRLLVEKWRDEAGYHNHPTSLYIRQCARELEECLK